MTTCVIAPDSSGYAMQPGSEVLSVKLDGGKSRKRRDILNSASTVNVTWTVDPEGYDYLNAFYRSIAKMGTVPFEIQLVLDYAGLGLYTASFVENSFKLTGQSGLRYTISAQLEVEPFTPDEAEDIALVTAYNAAHPI